ncbi:MAG: hypothetical protein ACLQVY_07430 [Limisphaerales bacterium]
MLSLTGCVGHVDGPGVAVTVSTPGVIAQDDYLYYPNYGVYYSGSRHEYAYLEGGAWVSRAGPPGISVAVLQASPSVKMAFHDSPANHHAAIARQYPKNWKPAGSSPKGGQHEEHGER